MKDFFISYNETDVDWAKWIAGTLEEYGYVTIIQTWDFRPGNNFVLEMQKAVLSCERIILILSQSYLNSEYCQAEWASIFNRDPTGKNAKLIPIRIADVKPEGLLSSIIYIDLFDQQEDVAIKRLLNGIGYNSENQRKKGEFPLNKIINENSNKNNKEIQFLFELEENHTVNEFPILTKNSLREWYYSNSRSNFKVTINDKQELLINARLNEIKSKQQDLTLAEEVDYHNYAGLLKRNVFEKLLKEKAIELFLRDDILQIYFGNTYLKSLDFVRRILEYDYYDQQKYNNSQYVKLDVFLDPAQKECHKHHFLVCIEKKKIDKSLGVHSLYNLFDTYVFDLERDIIKDIAIEYYLFLGVEIIEYNNLQLLHNKKIMNLLEYRVGLH